MEVTVWSFSSGLVKHALSALKKMAVKILKKDLVHQCDFLVFNYASPLGIYKSNMAVKNLVLEL